MNEALLREGIIDELLRVKGQKAKLQEYIQELEAQLQESLQKAIK